MAAKRVVITGLGALTPIGLTTDSYWEGLVQGKSGAGPITRFDASTFKTRFACELKGFDPADHFPKKEIRRMDPFSHYAMVVADQAIADAQLNFEQLDRTRIGVVLGAGIGGLLTFEEEVTAFATGDGTPRFNPFFIPKMIIDIAPGLISIKHGLHGPNYSCVSACATGSNCIIDAFLLIQSGLSDIIVAGGAEAAITVAGIGGFNAAKALSENNEEYATASRPFDLNRDGFVLGEGGAALIIEDYDHAIKRNARIYAELVGVGMSADAHHITAPHPEGYGARLVMANALKSANLKPEDIDYINVHGTSTPLGDIAETKAIKEVFGEHAYKLSVSSTKSMTGHLLGAAGAIEAVATILGIYHDLVPPTINHQTPDPECDLDYTFNQPKPRTLNYAISNTFGFGGHNTSLLFKKYINE
jgi:3-oxoacyl-[acyl-carrier-protein] synthase II